MDKLLRVFLLSFVSFLLLNGCGLQVSGSIEGMVLEEGSKKPIEGAIVVARWKGKKWPIQEITKCFHVESSMSNSNGLFKNTKYEV